MNFFVYLLRCSNGAYNVGSHRCQNVETRVYQQNEGIDTKAFTYRFRPVELLWSCQFDDPADMVGFEQQLKGWSRKKRKLSCAATGPS